MEKTFSNVEREENERQNWFHFLPPANYIQSNIQPYVVRKQAAWRTRYNCEWFSTIKMNHIFDFGSAISLSSLPSVMYQSSTSELKYIKFCYLFLASIQIDKLKQVHILKLEIDIELVIFSKRKIRSSLHMNKRRKMCVCVKTSM